MGDPIWRCQTPGSGAFIGVGLQIGKEFCQNVIHPLFTGPESRRRRRKESLILLNSQSQRLLTSSPTFHESFLRKARHSSGFSVTYIAFISFMRINTHGCFASIPFFV